MFTHEIDKDANFIHKIHLSNFGKDNKKCQMKNLMLWQDSHGKFGDQKIFLDESIRQFYLSRLLQTDRDNFVLQSSGIRNWWKDITYTDSGRSKHKLHYQFSVIKSHWTNGMQRKSDATDKSVGKLRMVTHDNKSSVKKRKLKKSKGGSRKSSKKTHE